MDWALQIAGQFWFASTIQVCGLFILAVTRLARPARPQTACQLAFLFCLFAVGLVTMLTIQSGGTNWVAGATTLSVMIVGATIDCRRARIKSPW
jgi:hypothetical protein